jgi:ABC-2 type transport system permease protein
MMKKIRTIIRKEWAEVFKNRMVIFSIVFMPLLFTAIPLIMLYAMKDSTAGGTSNSEIPPQIAQACDESLTTAECFQVYMVTSFMLMFMMTPMIIPVNFAEYSFVVEKTTRSLEPLLATPITTTELLTGKNLAAVIPAVAATWIGFTLFAIGTLLIAGDKILASFLSPMWLLAILVVGPLLAVLSVNFSLMVSSRVNDPRVAEQLSAVIILPLLLLFFGQITGFIFLNQFLILIISLILLVVDAGMVYLSVHLFERETILTRWR